MSDSKVDNLKLWESVEITDPSYTKNVTVKKQKRTSIDPQHQKKMATEKFGPYGIGWGIKPESIKYYRQVFGDTTLLFWSGIMFYKWDGEEGLLPVDSSIKEAYMSQSGYMVIDDEAIKKVKTNAITKGLSELGFNSDIFMGMFDLNGYQEHAAEEVANHNAEKAAEKQVNELKEYEEWKVKALEAFEYTNTENALKNHFNACATKVNKLGTQQDFNTFNNAYNSKLEKITEQS